MTTTSEATIRDDEAGTMTLGPWHGEGGGYALWHRGEVVWRSVDSTPRPVFPRPDWHTLRYQKITGRTFEEMRANAWRPNGIAHLGDALLVWVNEGDLYMVGATEVIADPSAPLRQVYQITNMSAPDFPPIPPPPTSEKTDAE
ncbi:hypothetical protein V5F79_22410 [Xanthobacter flavus]|uniref:hypothetical protein n=1 Tax=Xanthobacter flavus TaxID=281 RepID=UPI00372B09B8